MSDPFVLAAQTAAAALSVEPQPFSSLTYAEFRAWATVAELKELVATLRRRLPAGEIVLHATLESVVSPEALRAAQLRRDLDLGTVVDVDGESSLRVRRCLLPWPKSVPDCECAEIAIGEAVGRVERVDASMVAAVRARAGVLHARLLRRLERARVSAERSRLAGVPGASAPARPVVDGRARVVGLADVGIPDGLVFAPPHADVVEVPQSAGRPSPRRRTAPLTRIPDQQLTFADLSLRLTGLPPEPSPPANLSTRRS